MYIHYPGNSLGLRWTIYRGLSRITEDFESATLTCVLYSKDNKFPVEATVMSAADGGSYLYIELSPELQLPDGIYGVSAIWKKNEDRSIARSMREGLFSVVNNQAEATDQGGTANIPVLKFHSSAGTFGYDGLSAYELALLKGLTTKSETEWVQEQLDVATDQIFDAKDVAVGQAETAITAAKDVAVGQAEDAVDAAKDAAVSAANTAIGESKENALDAIAEAIEGLEVHYDVETDKGAVKDVQLKDGQGNKLMPITNHDNDVKENFNDLAHRHGLDFSSYTSANKYRYLDVIVYAYATLKPTAAETKVEIYALAKNRNSDGNLRIWFHLIDNNLNIQKTLPLSDISLENGYYTGIAENSKVKINYLLNVDAFNDGEVIIFGGTEGKRVCVDIVGLNDIRRKWFTIPPENYAIQQQLRNLDFTSYPYDVTPYIKTVLFCGIKWNVNKPDWAYDKPHLYALAWNYNNNGRIDIGILLGQNGSNFESIWLRKNIDYNDTIPTYEFATVNSYWCKLYVAYNPLEMKAAGGIVYSDSENIVKVGELEEEDPRIVQFEAFNKIDELNERVSSIEANPNFWNGKKLVWYGTSIPAGSDSALGQEGIGITYPEIAASYIGASCSNEAVGSGRASYLPLTRNETFQHLARCQGGTIASKLELLKSIYIIDDDNRTVVMGANTYGITGLPYSSAPTYEQAVALRTEIISYSYEIKLISRYLDSTNQYISNVLNSQEVKDLLVYSGNSYELLYRDSMAYKYTPDLFVFDHGTNDNAYLGSDVDSRDATTFYGAMNIMYDWIQFYSPKSLVCQVTDYGTSRYGNDSVIQHQQAWAEYWQIPLLRTCDVVPWNGALVTLQGYWDGGNGQSGRWHNDGFYFNESGNAWETNNGIILRKYTASTPASTIISDFNIRTIEGHQVYTVQQKYKYFKDGLHPHTDSSGDALKFYAKHLSKMLIGIAPNSD